MERGITYLTLGPGILVRLAVSLHSLRRYWQGPVALFHDVSSVPILQQIATAAGNVTLTPFDCEGRRAYCSKPMLPAISPYEQTIQIDTDTMWLASPEPLFDMLTPQRTIFTEFSGWVTTGKRMRGRFSSWQATDPEKYQAILAKPWPALNTGVVAFGSQSRVAREVWLQQTLQHPREFIVDETAANLLLPWYGPDEILVVDDSWNWSPKFGPPRTPREAAKVAHFHGRKHTKDGRMREVWLPEFQACWRENWAGIREWCPAHDKRLEEFLLLNPEVTNGI